jgi:gliding motility-associated-like protein
MTKLFLILFTFNCALSLKAQSNLVPNGNFEDTVSCGGIYGAMQDWFVPQNDKVDIDKACTYIDWWRFIKYRKIGRDNSRSGFIETYYRGFPDDNVYSGRRYLAVKLKETLVAGQQYYFEMYTRAVDTFPNFQLVNTLFTIGQDVAFSKEYPLFDFDVPRNYLKNRPVFRSLLKKDYNWYKINGCFTADGGEQYMIIGNFRNDADTEIVPTGKTNRNFPSGLSAYYVIDNVVLTPMTLNIRDTAICTGDTFRLNVLKTIPDSVSYKWHNGGTTPQYLSTKSEYITVELLYPTGCTLSQSMNLTVLTPDYQPQVRDTIICVGQNITFTAGTGRKEETISWDNGSTKREYSINTANLTPSSGEIYTALIKNSCAQWTDSFRIKTRDCGYGLYMPTAFSPNGDGENDIFKPFLKADYLYIETYDFKVFNRWGNLIFQSDTIQNGWDGSFKGSPLPNDVYVWQLIIRHKFNEKTEVLKVGGDVTIMR